MAAPFSYHVMFCLGRHAIATQPALLALAGRRGLVLLTSSSPGRGIDHHNKLSSSRFVELVNQAYASLFGCFVAHTNRVGFEDGVNFWGGSSMCALDGELIAQSPYWEESLLVTTLDLARYAAPARRAARADAAGVDSHPGQAVRRILQNARKEESGQRIDGTLRSVRVANLWTNPPKKC